MNCVLGFDVGSRLTGVAIGNMLTAGARPLATIPMREGRPDWTRLDALRETWQPDTLVVGLPLQADGSEQPASRAARRFAAELHARYALPVAFMDERDSSREAAERFARARAAGSRRRRDRASLDADAAAIILERWLQGADATPNDRASIDRTPVDPAPVDPTPIDPAPTDPALIPRSPPNDPRP